jgi:hypothetical protein
MKGHRYVLMDSTPGAAGSGAGGAGGGSGNSGAGGASSDGGAGNAGAAGAAGAGANSATGAGASNPVSAMAAGAAAEGAGSAGGGEGSGASADPWGFIPEKFIVKNAAGEIDQAASARKVEEHRANLEKRLGTGDIPPKSAADYKLPEPPEALKGMAFDDAATSKFKDDAHKAGLTPSQFEFVMGKYFELAPALVNGGQQVKMEDTVKTLKDTWGDSYQANATAAWRGMSQIAEIAGLPVDEVEAELGNSPAFNRIMAAVGQQLKEDKSVNPGNAAPGGGGMEEAATIQMSDAFRNPKNPGHQAALAKWNAIVTKGVPNTPVF